MEFVDTHTHLFAEEFNQEQSETIYRAVQANVRTFLLPNIDIESIQRLKDLSKLAPDNCYPMMGLHPCSVTADFRNTLNVIKEELYSSYPYFGVGEIGLDLYWDKTNLDNQEKAFVSQCEWAVELNLPISIHTRNATAETINCLKSMKKMPKGVFHCFSGSRVDAEEILKLGFYLGIGGVVTFKNSGLHEILKEVPVDKLVLETDSPYLAPVPFRGKRNESSYLPYIAEKLAEIYRLNIERIAEVTTQNAKSVFSL